MNDAFCRADDLSDYQGLGHTLLSPAEKLRLLAKMVKAREENRRKAYRRHRDAVVRVHLRFGLSLVRQYARSSVPQEDLLQIAAIALLRAADTYDPNRGTAFSSYAAWWVRAQIGRHIGNHGRTIRTPIHRQTLSHKLFTASARFEAITGRCPTERELAIATGLSLKTLRRVALDGASLPIASLDAKITTHGETHRTLLDALPAPSPSPEETLQEREQSTSVRRLLAALPERERAVIAARFGLDDGHERTLDDIGRDFGVTREGIRQLEASALERLRRVARFQFDNFGRPVMSEKAADTELKKAI